MPCLALIVGGGPAQAGSQIGSGWGVRLSLTYTLDSDRDCGRPQSQPPGRQSGTEPRGWGVEICFALSGGWGAAYDGWSA